MTVCRGLEILAASSPTLNAGGYGIRDSFITGMGFLTRLDATGNGKHLDTRTFEKSVLLSAGSKPDKVFLAPSSHQELHLRCLYRPLRQKN